VYDGVVATTDTPAARPDGQRTEDTQQPQDARRTEGIQQTEGIQPTESTRAGRERTGTAFLLAQLGSYAAERFGERAGALDFTRPQAGLLRLISREPGQSQQAVARRLGTPPSRLVALVDGLEQRGLIERRRNPGDRRNYALYLTPAGEQAMAGLAQAAADHDEEISAPLTPAERAELHKLLAKLAAAHGLLPGVHPGYRHLAAADTDARPAGQEMR
jgi:DNA-binding MarR family transcriptional regulator